MIRARVIRALFRKDMVDGIRESRVLISLITPIILAVLYNVLFPDERVVQVKVRLRDAARAERLIHAQVSVVMNP